jgi:hypothetical protein
VALEDDRPRNLRIGGWRGEIEAGGFDQRAFGNVDMISKGNSRHRPQGGFWADHHLLADDDVLREFYRN